MGLLEIEGIGSIGIQILEIYFDIIVTGLTWVLPSVGNRSCPFFARSGYWMCFLQEHLWCLFSHLIVYCLRRGAPHTWSTPNKFGSIVWMKWTCTTLSTVGCAISHRWRATQHRWRGFVRLMAWESGPQSRWLRQTLWKGLLWLVDFKGFKNSLSKSFNPQLARNLAVFNLYYFQVFVPFGTCVLICESRKPTKTKSQQQETRRKTTTHTHNTKNGLTFKTQHKNTGWQQVQSSK